LNESHNEIKKYKIERPRDCNKIRVSENYYVCLEPEKIYSKCNRAIYSIPKSEEISPKVYKGSDGISIHIDLTDMYRYQLLKKIYCRKP
jgi:hypothetical protein